MVELFAEGADRVRQRAIVDSRSHKIMLLSTTNNETQNFVSLCGPRLDNTGAVALA